MLALLVYIFCCSWICPDRLCLFRQYRHSFSSPRAREGKSLLSIGGDNLQFYPDFALFSTLGDESRPLFFQVSKVSEEQKKRSSPKMELLFSPNSGEDQKKGLHQKWNQARSHKFAMRWANFWVWGWSLQPPKANRGWGRRPQPPEAQRTGGGAPSAQKICIFFQK